MTAARFLLIRHGETDDNVRRVFQGQGGAALNTRGREQAALLAARLARLPVDALYASDLDRARETAAFVSEATGLAATLDPALREVHIGAWQGLGMEALAERFPEEWAAFRRGEDIRRGGGETYADVAARIAGALDRIAAAHPGRTIAVVSHGTAIKTFVARVLGVPTERLRTFRVPANTAVSLVERDAETDRLLVWNDASHLHDAVLEALSAPP
jgi:probable phosphoglycerate mutase